MPHFLAQSYVAQRDQAIAAIGRARQIRSPLLLRAIFVPSDEIFLTVWHGLDEDAVDTATREVGLGPGRVVPIEELTAPPDPPNPGGRPGRWYWAMKNKSPGGTLPGAGAGALRSAIALSQGLTARGAHSEEDEK